MASRHEIVTIDFRANAAKANPAMESLRLSAKDCRTEIERLDKEISHGIDTGMSKDQLEKLGKELSVQEKKLRSFETAMSTLSKGVGTLARAIDAFNSGSLNQMSAAFQKAAYNAAEVAKKALSPLSETYAKDMAELDALQQKNLENLAKFKLRTEQMLKSIGEGGKISSSDLKQEADGIKELMQLLPHMSNEWQDYNTILTQINNTVKQQADAEQRLKGAIVDANDARERARQLTRDGAEAAARESREAEKEVSMRNQIIDGLKKEREEKAKQVSTTAALVQAKDEDIKKQEKKIASIQKEIDNEKKNAEAKQKSIDKLNQEATTYENTAKANREAVGKMREEVKGLDEELKKANEDLAKMGEPKQGANATVSAKEGEAKASESVTVAKKDETTVTKESAAAKEKETQASKENAAAKEQEAKAEEKSAEAQKKETLSLEELEKKQVSIVAEINALIKERDELTIAQEKGTKAIEAEAAAAEKEANAFKSLGKEQAEALLKQKQALATITKGADGKISYTNAEEAQNFLIETIGSVNPKGKSTNALSLEDDTQVAKVRELFKARYGLQDDADVKDAIKGLLSSEHGGLIKGGMMNNFFSRIDLDPTKVAAYTKEIKDLTEVVNGETKATEGESQAKKELEETSQRLATVLKQIDEKTEESLALHKLRRSLMAGEVDATEDLTKNTDKLSEANRKNAESVKEQIEAIKKMSAEEAKASLTSMTKVSTVGYKEGKLDMSNPQEVQGWLIAQMRKRSIPTRDGRIAVSGSDVDSILSGFQNRYGWTGDKKTAKDLLREIAQGRDGGLLKEGGVVDYNVGTLMIKQNNEEYARRVTILKELVAASKGVEQSTAKSTETTKKDVEATDASTKATEKETDAIQKQIEEVERRRNAYEKANKTYEEANTKLKGMRSAKSRLPVSGLDAQLARHDAEEEIKEYNENTVKPARAERTQLKKLWEQSVKQLLDMQQKSTDAENKEAEATEKTTKSKRGKKKAVEEVTDAQKESNKVEEESVKSGEKLSAEDQKRLELQKKKQELESQRSAKLDEINKKEEEAAGLEVKANNNRSEAARKTNELANAHGNNAEKMKTESDVLEKLQGEQKVHADQLNKERTELDGIDKKIDENAEARVKAEQKKAQAQKLTIDAMNDAIKALEAENRAIEPQSARWNENVRLIQQYKAEVDRLKNQPVMQMMTERLGNIKNLSNDALTETKKFWQAMYDGADRGSHKMDVAANSLRMLIEEERQRNQELQVPMRERLSKVGRLSTADLAETKKYWESRRDSLDQYVEDGAGNLVENREYRKAVLAAKTAENEENRRKAHAQAQLINDQMQKLNTLSAQGLADVKRYWQAMADGAAYGSDELKDAEAALQRINKLESGRSTEALKASAERLNGNLGNLNQGDLRQAIEDAKKFQLTLKSTSKEAQELSKRIVEAEDFVRRYGVEAERAARKQEEADKRAARAARDKADADMLAAQQERTEMMQRSLESRRKTLSAEALAETKKYWETVERGAEEGSVAQRNALTIMERITAEEQRRANIANEKLASKLGGNLSDMSEGEIRKAVEAGQKLIQTYKSGSTEAENLAKNIVAAEEHVKQYGVEAQRAAVREAEALKKAAQQRQENDALMKQQLQQETSLSQSALKAQEQYWQRLIDDPKTAAESLQEYKNNLQEVQRLQSAQVMERGESALQRFRNDPQYTESVSENALKETIDDLKAYRDSLPKSDNAEIIAEINSYITKTGEAAKVAAGEMMSLSDAEALAGKLGTKGFTASTNQLNLAKKALEDAQIAAGRGSARFTELQDKINKVDIELAKTGEIAKSVQDTLDQPKGKGINELKQAVEQGRVALYAMDRSTEEGQKQFDELAKKIKNADFELKRLTGTAKGSATAFDKAWSRLKTYIGLYVGAAVAMQKIVATMGDLMELSDKMGEVRKTTGFTADEVGRLSDNLKKLDVRTSLTSLMELSSLAGSVGLKTQEDVQGFTEAANQLMIALPEMGNESARTLIKIAQATGDLKKNNNDVRETLEKVGSTIIALRANSASAAGPITDFVSRVGAVGAQSGISIDQIAALGSTIDALGGRVEMSATALSRMIPAIRNNSFAVANSIGVTESYLKSLSAMDQMVLIFEKLRDSIKGINTETEEGQQQMADNVEAVLGKNAVMAEVMKDLNQQGARAGIVFGLLSQNVDELQRQLGIAGNAYEKNMALQEEFNKMNDTTAAKWERLKNQFEEMFVSDSAQRSLGVIIDMLRWFVDLLSGDNGISSALRKIILAIAIFKTNMGVAIVEGIKKITLLGNAFKTLRAAIFSINGLWNMLAFGATLLITKLIDLSNQTSETSKAIGGLEGELNKEISAVNKLFVALTKAREQERLNTEATKEAAKAEEAKAISSKKVAKAAKESAKVTEDTAKVTDEYIKSLNLVEAIEKERTKTANFFVENTKKLEEATKKTTKAEQEHLVEEKALAEQFDLVKRLEKQRLEIAEALNSHHLKEVVVTAKRITAEQNLAQQFDLVKKIEEQRMEIAEALNSRRLKEVVVTAKRIQAEQKLAEQSDLVKQFEERRAEIAEVLNTHHLKEVVVTEKRITAEQSLADEYNLVKQLEERRAEIAEVLNARQLQGVTVIAKRIQMEDSLFKQSSLIEALEARRAEIAEVLNSHHLKEVVVTAKRINATEALADQFNLVKQIEERRAEIAEVLNTHHLKEVVVTAKRINVEKNLADQFNLVKQIEERRAEIANIFTLNTEKLSAATEKLAEKDEKVAAETKKVEEGMHRVNIEGKESADIIRDINSKYGTYLGYMMSETASAEQLAKARELINSKLRETITLKQREQAMNDIEQEYGKTVRKKASDVDDQIQRMFAGNEEAGARVSLAISEAAQKYAKNSQTFEKAVKKVLVDNQKFIDKKLISSVVTTAAQSDVALSDEEAIKNLATGLVNNAKRYRVAVETYQEEEERANRVFDARENVARSRSRNASLSSLNTIVADWKDLMSQYREEKDEEKKKKLAVEVYKQQKSYADLYANNIDYFTDNINKKAIEHTIANMKTYEKGLRKVAGDAIKAVDAAGGSDTTTTPTTNPYGDFNRVTDSYEKWDADSLVSRRKEMLERVRALANGADVQAVLSEDAKFITEATRKNIKTTRDAIEWYNTERLKIQDALHEKHLTNTGDWMDPTNRRGREKTLKAEWKAYLDELDAYYTARKTKIQDARNDEMITEAEAWRRTLQNDTEWRQRRAELQQLYANKSAKVTAEETEAIYEILAEQTGESSDYIKKDIAQTVKFILAIGEKSKDEMEKLIGQLDKGTEQDFFRQRVAIGKQMDAIADIIEKERPFNGITKNLEENLTKIGVLQADFEKKRLELVKKREDTSELDKEYEAEVPKRIAFLLEEAEHAYNTTIEEVVARMEKAGMTAWAEEIKNDPTMQEAIMGQLHSTFDKIQEAIKKEASLWKKEAENMWNNILMPDGKTTLKQVADQVTAQLSLDANRTGRANSLIGAGQASERVVDKLAIQQMKVELAMQQHYYNLVRERGQAAINNLARQAALAKERGDIEEATRKELEAQHARMTLNLATTKEQTELAKQQEEIVARTEESQNRLYKELKSWAEMIGASLQSVFEASHAGDKEYYNERAKLDLTGKGGPGAGTYIIIDNERTSDAKAHYEYLDEREALERQREIERQNALADAWRKVMDDINMKMSETITDQVNAMMQNQSIDANTQAVLSNTEALSVMTGKIEELKSGNGEVGGTIGENGLRGLGDMGLDANGVPNALVPPTEQGSMDTGGFDYTRPFFEQIDASNQATKTLTDNNKKIANSTQSTFAAMTQAANLYGVAYQAMSNDNLDTTQKFQMIALQAAGNAAISGLTAALAQDTAETTSSMPAILAKCLKISPIWGSVLFGALTATLGGLMGLATSKIAKSKSTIAQVTGASASAGRLATGMLTYAEGNVNEFSDPKSLTPGRMYDVDAADGHTYRARYMGDKPRTHLTNGPEFHLSGEKGREMIIDAGTTRQITMNEGEIWRAIQTLSGGGRLRHSVRRGRGMANFADGNVEDFDVLSGEDVENAGGFTPEMAARMQASLDRNSEVLERALREGIKGVFDVYGKGGLVDSYDTGKRTVNRYGERY